MNAGRGKTQGNATPVGQACTLLSTWTGLELRGTAPRRVAEFLNSRAAQLGYTSKDDYVAFLQTQQPTDDEPQQLTNLVTNGLTCFWRDEPQLHALQTLFEELADERGTERPIQVWCAGCSTGEEAYTVAMIAREHGVTVDVLGSDINTESLRHARQGVYGEWSLRRTDDERRQRHFLPTDDGRFRIGADVRRQVRFAYHNILTPAPAPLEGDKWDVVLCRNVLIYFSDDAMRTVLRHFSDAIDTDGYLLLGSSEQLHTGNLAESLVPFRAARQGGGFVYRLRDTPPGRTVVFPPREPPSQPELTPPTLDLNFTPTLEEETSDVTGDLSTNEAANNLLSTAMEHMDEGLTEAALACCEATASYDPFVPENYCLMGYLLAQEGAFSQALETYRKVLFLDPFNWVAAIESARLHMRQRDAIRARRSLRQAHEGLASGRRLSRGMRQLLGAMDRAITEREPAEAFCEQYLERLRGAKFLD